MALGYRDLAVGIRDKNVALYGINDKGSTDAQIWIDNEHLPFLILQDPGRTVGTAYGMSEPDGERYVANPSDGRRPAVVIDENGYIIAWDPDMNTVEQILALLEKL